ncbi:hypothetical protein HRbin36_02197 [bacterium HR36]|nr:hypothetical protein HRbin36_02197 [bacterium HR36]
MKRTVVWSWGWMLLGAAVLSARPPQSLNADNYATLRQQIKPQPGESRYWEIPWLLSLDEALRRGAAEGKPIFVFSGAGGPPHAFC